MPPLTTDQAATRAQVSRQYILAEIAAGRLKATKLDPSKLTSTYTIEQRDFDNWMKKRGQPISD